MGGQSGENKPGMGAPRRPSRWLVQKRMSDALRTAYGDVVNEPVPDNLKHLIQTIRQKSAGK